MSRALTVVLCVVAIDAIGIGVVMPVLPSLLRELGRTRNIATFYGILMASYAAMQFLFSPLLGALSDRYGRRPVLLCSLIGATIDYLVTAAAPTIGILATGRILAGITGANLAVATSCIADLTPADARAKRFGQMGAVMGLGFVAGPALGGLLGTVSLRAPYVLAAMLNAGNGVLVLLLLPETRSGPPARFVFSPRALLPSFAVFRSHPDVPRLVGAYAVLFVAAQVPMALWILYCQRRYGWDARLVGLSIALYGLFYAIGQGYLIGPITRRIGERRGVMLGMVSDAAAYVILGLASQGWVPFALMPLFCLGGIAVPSLQAMISGNVAADRQGRLQGSLVSLSSLIGIPGPILVTFLFARTASLHPGLVWLGAAAAELLVAPLLVRRRRDAFSAPSPCGSDPPIRP